MISVLRILLKNNNPYQAILDRMKTSACQTSRESMGEKTSSNNFDLVLGDLDHTHVISDLDLGNLDLWPSTLTLMTLTSYSDSWLKNTVFLFNLDFWPMTLTFDPILAKVKVNLHAKNKVIGQRV